MNSLKYCGRAYLRLGPEMRAVILLGSRIPYICQKYGDVEECAVPVPTENMRDQSCFVICYVDYTTWYMAFYRVQPLMGPGQYKSTQLLRKSVCAITSNYYEKCRTLAKKVPFG